MSDGELTLRKSAPIAEPNYHLSIEPAHCPEKTKEKFILFYTPIAANATRTRKRARRTSDYNPGPGPDSPGEKIITFDDS